MSVFSVLFAGVGGQGVLLTSRILAEAALMAGNDVKQSEVHGMAQRGGSVVSQVRFGEKVFSPIISEGECDLIIGFEPLETARYIHLLKPGGTVVYNTRRVVTLTVSTGLEKYPEDIDSIISSRAGNVYPLNATALAVKAGEKRALNLVLLGAAQKFLPIDGRFLREAMEKNLPSKALTANRKAFISGKSCMK